MSKLGRLCLWATVALLSAVLLSAGWGPSRALGQRSPAMTSQPSTLTLQPPLPPSARVFDPHVKDVTYFPAVGHTLRSGFRDYWQRYGGLAQFGYPLTEEFREVSPTDGKAYTVQYFERARFEWHPEKRPPYDVLLGLLGRAVTGDREQERPFRPAPPQPGPAALYFKETGHNLPAQFAIYWRAHGGRPIYGYPISEAFDEASPTDGKTYLVQYFERNRLEYHPELPQAFRVSLGLLGVEVLSAPGVVPANDTSQLITSNAIGRPGAAGRYLFWIEKHKGSNYIMTYNLFTGRTDQVASTLGQPTLASDGETLVWVEATEKGDSIMAYDLASKRISGAVEGNYTAIEGVGVDAGVLYYTRVSMGLDRIALNSHNLATGAEQLISNLGQDPVAADGKLLWVERVQLPCSPTYPDPETGETGQWCPWDWDLHLYFNGSDKKIASGVGEDGFRDYHISGNKIVWSVAGEAFVYDIASGTERDISGKPVMDALISGNTVVWTFSHIPPTGEPALSSLEVAQISGKIVPEAIVKDTTARIEALAIAQRKWLLFAVRADPSKEEKELRITRLDSRDLSFAGLAGK